MKKLLALILALVLALSCAGSLAEAVRIDPKETTQPEENLPPIDGIDLELPAVDPCTTTLKLTLDADIIKMLATIGGLNEKLLGVIDPVIAILNNATTKISVAEEGSQLDLLLQDTAVASFALAKTEDGFAVASDLFPNCILVVDGETVNALLSSIKDRIGTVNNLDIDAEALVSAVLPYVMTCVSAVAEKIGDPEPGSYTFEDEEFNIKIPINMTTKEAVLLVLNTVKGILSEEAVVSALEQISSTANIDLPFNVESLDETIAEFEEGDEESQPVLDAAMYKAVNEDGESANTYFVLELTKEEETVSLKGGRVNGMLYGHVNVKDSITVDLVGLMEDGVLNVGIDVNVGGMYIGLAVKAGTAEEAKLLTLAVYFLNPQSPAVVLDVVSVPGAEVTMTVDPADKTVITLEQLMNDEDGTAMNSLLMDVMSNGLNGLLGKAAAVMPEEVVSLINLASGAGEEEPAEEAAE